MQVKVSLQDIPAQLKRLNALNKIPNNFLIIRKGKSDSVDIVLDINKQVAAQIRNPFGHLFAFRDSYYGVYHEDSGMLEVFTHAALHQHTEYSILDGANTVKALAKKMAHDGAITDHGVMYGVIDFYKKMHDQHKHPITGFEAYHEGFRGDFKAKHHAPILCKNAIGYRNAVKLCTEAQKNYGGKNPARPLVTLENFKKYHEGLVVLSGCMAGAIPQAILAEDEELLAEVMKFFIDTFGEDFYLEIQRHGSDARIQAEADKVNMEYGLDYSVQDYKNQFESLGKKDFRRAYSKKLMEEVQIKVQEDKVNARLVSLSKQYGVKLVATTDAHYLNAEDAYVHDALLCNQVKDVLTNPNRWQFPGENYHVMTQDEMEKLFFDMPEAVVNTLEVADKCKYDVEFGNYKLPEFDIPAGFSQDGYLSKLAWEGFEERFSGTEHEYDKTYINQLQFELETIKKTGYAGYFLIVWDYVRWAKEQGIAVGPGRGSGAGSLVLYCLHITEALDPLKFGLLFERERDCVH